MKQSTFVKCGVLAFSLAVLTFLVRGSTRLFVGERTATVLSAPIGLAALALLIGLFFVALLAATGLRPIEADTDDRQ